MLDLHDKSPSPAPARGIGEAACYGLCAGGQQPSYFSAARSENVAGGRAELTRRAGGRSPLPLRAGQQDQIEIVIDAPWPSWGHVDIA